MSDKIVALFKAKGLEVPASCKCGKVVAMRCVVDGKVKLLCADCYSKL